MKINQRLEEGREEGEGKRGGKTALSAATLRVFVLRRTVNSQKWVVEVSIYM